jgi:VWFA-related protein
MAALAIVLAGAVGSLHALQSQVPAPQQAPPQFRAGTEIVQLDVLVLDKQRRPVRGLTADDFIVLENGKPQPVVSFAAVDVPVATPAPTARWMREVPADVSTNQLDSRRVVAIVFDDATVRRDLATLKAARDAAHKVIDELGPSDLAAVVLTMDNRRPQDFTTDRARLHAAVDIFSVGFIGSCDCGLCSIRPLTEVSRILQSVSGQRKVIVYISTGVQIDWEQADKCGSRPLFEMRRAFRASELSNVSIYSIDPSGLKIDERLGGPVEYLQVMSENTGGRPIINHNSPYQEVPRILSENGSYYLLGYELKGVKPEGDF